MPRDHGASRAVMDETVLPVLRFNYQRGAERQITKIDSAFDFRLNNVVIYLIAEVGMGSGELHYRVIARQLHPLSFYIGNEPHDCTVFQIAYFRIWCCESKDSSQGLSVSYCTTHPFADGAVLQAHPQA